MKINGPSALLGLVVVCLTSPHQTGAAHPRREMSVPRLRLISAENFYERAADFRHGRHKTNNHPIKVIMLMIQGLDLTSQLSADLFNYTFFPIQVDFKVCHQEKCNCTAQLTSQVSSLLTWARIMKRMSTSALYQTNYPGNNKTSRTGPKPQNPELHDILARILDDLTMSNAHGHLVVANIDIGELPYALAILRGHGSGSNTLVVVTSSCPPDVSQSARLFARGPGAEYLAFVRALPQVPEILRFAIDSRIDYKNAELAPFDFDVPRPRFARNDTVTAWGHQESGSVTMTILGTALAFVTCHALKF